MQRSNIGTISNMSTASLGPRQSQLLQAAASFRRPVLLAAVQCKAQQHPGDPAALAQMSRRSLLGATFAVVSLLGSQQPSLADAQLPRGYQEFAVKLIQSLEDAIQVDLDGAEEREVRRKADPAKNLVREFVQKWRDAPLLQEQQSHRLISDTIQQLGRFYQANGVRARLSQDVGSQLLRQLHQAEESLPPPPEQKLLPFPF